MGERVMENMDFLSSILDVFVQFLLNISGNMNNREKIVIKLFVEKFVEYFFIENVILRVFKKKIIEIGSRVQELWPKYFLRISTFSTFSGRVMKFGT